MNLQANASHADSTWPDELTVLMLSYNEEDNIGRSLACLKWAKRIIVLDSFSSDKTEDIVREHETAAFVKHEFETHAKQWNHGLDLVKTKWVLTLDADYLLPDNASAEIAAAMQRDSWGYQARFEYLIAGQKVRGSILPPRTVLFKTKDARYVDDGHTQRLVPQGLVTSMPLWIAHDDRKPLSRWCNSQISYAAKEAEKLSSTDFGELTLNDKIRRFFIVAPPLVFLWVFCIRGGFLSGKRGLYYSLQRLTAECLLSVFLLDKKLFTKRN